MKIKNIQLTIVAVLSVVLLSGCNIYGKFKMPKESAIAAEYAKALEAEADTASFGNLRWQEVFTDPVLVDLIETALANNKDLNNAKLNVDIAHASLKGAKLSYLPSVALAPNGSGSKYGSSSFSWGYQLPMSVSWEIDIFGKLLNNKRGSQAAYNQAKHYSQAVRSQIIAAVANCYYGLVALESRLTLNRATAESWKESVEVMKNLKLASRGVTEAAVVQSEAQYYGILGAITDIETALDELNNTMSLLLNVMPQKWSVNPEASLSVPEIMRDAIPMRELAARPDVRAAEQALAAAYYTTAGARAAFYPGLAITANGGFTNILGSMIVNPAEFFVQLAGSLTMPLFSRGSNIARLEASKAQQKQAMNNFEYALLNASAEVSNAMLAYEKSLEKQEWLKKQVESLEKAVEYTQILLTVGTQSTTYLEVLTAQQNLLSSQTSLILCDQARAGAVINLYQSLGGGR